MYMSTSSPVTAIHILTLGLKQRKASHQALNCQGMFAILVCIKRNIYIYIYVLYNIIYIYMLVITIGRLRARLPSNSLSPKFAMSSM